MPEKPTLVILPGWGGSHYTWQEFIALASRHFNVHCFDLPCFGAEPCPTEVWGIEEYAEFVKQKLLRVTMHESRVMLLGHSFGGQVAVCLAAQHPALVDKLILSGAAVVRPNRVWRRAISAGIAAAGKIIIRAPILRTHEDFIKKIFYRLIDAPDYLETAGIKREIYKKIIRQDGTRLLPRIHAPTLVVWGTKDRLTPLRQGRKIFKLLPKAQWRAFKRTRHALHRERPSELLAAIREFIIYDQSP